MNLKQLFTGRLGKATLALVLLGVFFRFYNLGTKIFWGDECGSMLLVAGYTRPQVCAETATRAVWTAGDFRKYQEVNPGHDVARTVNTLGYDDPQHPPLYFVLLHLWARLGGTDVAWLRALSAVISLLGFPALWWLCRELFTKEPHQKTLTQAALSLWAICPYHVLYAQELRPYSEWTVAILVSGAALLHALRKGTLGAWLLYGLLLGVSFYCHTLSAFMWLAHLVFLLVVGRKTVTVKHFGYFALATLLAVLMFSPWLMVLLESRERASSHTSWITMGVKRLYVLQSWVFITSVLYFDPNLTQRWQGIMAGIGGMALRLVRVGLFAFILCSLVQVRRKAARPGALLILAMTLVPVAAFALPDMIWGGTRSAVGRFLITALIGVQLAVAYAVGTGLTGPKRPRYILGFVTLVIAGIFSCAFSSQSPAWWTRTTAYYVPGMAEKLNAKSRPLVVVYPEITTFALVRLLRPETRLYVAKKGFEGLSLKDVKEKAGGGEIFLFEGTPEARALLEKQGGVVKKAIKDDRLWAVT